MGSRNLPQKSLLSLGKNKSLWGAFQPPRCNKFANKGPLYSFIGLYDEVTSPHWGKKNECRPRHDWKYMPGLKVVLFKGKGEGPSVGSIWKLYAVCVYKTKDCGAFLHIYRWCHWPIFTTAVEQHPFLIFQNWRHFVAECWDRGKSSAQDYRDCPAFSGSLLGEQLRQCCSLQW